MSKGGYRPNSGRKPGSIPWNKGMPMSEASKKRVSVSKKGTPAWNKGMEMPEVSERMKGNNNGSGNKGRIMSPEWRAKLSAAKKGKPSPNKGRKLTREWIEKIAASKRGKAHSAELIEANRQGQIRRYKKLNPDYELKGRNKRIADNGGTHSKYDWEGLKEKYNHTCPSCKKKEPEIKLTRDHIVALLNGGDNSIKNIQPLCQSCNTRKHTKTIRY